MTFDHVGIPTDEKQPGENWVESTRVWVTSPRDSKYRIEYLRFEPDSPFAEIVRTRPHVAYAVNEEEWHRLLAGAEIVIEPFKPCEHMTIAYVKQHDVCIEYIRYTNADYWFDSYQPGWV